MFFSLIISLILINFSLLDNNEMNYNNIDQLDKKAKVLACSLLSSSYLLKRKKKENEIKELLIKHKIITQEEEATEKISQFMSALCYSKIDDSAVSRILLTVSEGAKGVIGQDENFNNLFEIKKINFKKMKKIMNEILVYMKEIEEDENKNNDLKEEENLNLEDNINLEENLKNINKKMIKNKRYEKNDNKNEKKDEKKDEESQKKKKNNKKKKKNKKDNKDNKEKEKIENKAVDDKKFSFNFKFDFNLKNFFEKVDFTIIWGFFISLIIILI